MKIVLPLLIALLAFTGCTRRYVITTNSGSRIDTTSKPKRQGAVYVFKDASGRETYIHSGRVSEIAPASMAKEAPNDSFKPVTRQ